MLFRSCEDPEYLRPVTTATTATATRPPVTRATTPGVTRGPPDTTGTPTRGGGGSTGPTRTVATVTREPVTVTSRVIACGTCEGNPSNKNNGKCNNVNNNCGCDWDGGDCCGPAQTANQYSSCTAGDDGTCCLDPTYRPDITTTVITTGTTTGTTAGATTGTTTSRAPEVGLDSKFSVITVASCLDKFGCLGTSCDKVIKKMAKKGEALDYDFLKYKYGCDCTLCGYIGGAPAIDRKSVV